MYFSGAWRGYWEQAGFGRQSMFDLTLQFDGGSITGEGYDCIGAFTFAGEYDEQGSVYLVKQYIGRHKVAYNGRYDGEGTIFGHWSIGEFWSGPFALRPEKFAVADAPILTIAAPVDDRVTR
jgi:hypothetical protein